MELLCLFALVLMTRTGTVPGASGANVTTSYLNLSKATSVSLSPSTSSLVSRVTSHASSKRLTSSVVPGKSSIYFSPSPTRSSSSHPSASPTSGPKPTTKPTTTLPPPRPHPKPSSGRRFDAASFIGGILFCGGLVLIIYIAVKCYRSRPNYNKL